MKQKLNCVLLIDDDEPTNYFSRMILERCECTEKVTLTQGGEAALRYLEAPTPPCPELIFLDINMPAMNGWEFLDKYRELDDVQKGKIVIVMLTTSLNPDDKDKAAGIPEISGFASKPLTPKKLTEILLKHFPERF